MARQIKLVLIDLSGTLHIDNFVIPGAVAALKKLRTSNTKIKFLTNTTKESQTLLHNRLNRLGFDIEKDEIFSSLAAAHKIVQSRGLNPFLLIDDAAMETFENLKKPEEEFNTVVVGLAPHKFCYDELNQAFRLLLQGASLIAIHEGRYYKRTDGLALGPGAFIKGLEYSANVTAEVIGKPARGFFETALGGIPPESAIMIGDDITDDIAGAQAVGIRGFLVQTGKYRPGDEALISPPPAKIIPSFVEAVDEILKEFSE